MQLRMTNAGVLLFAKDSSRFLKSAPIVCVVYQGEDKVEILDRKIYNDGLIGNIEAALTYLKRHIDVRFEIKSFVRREIPQYPEEAVREAVVNALLHRDYFDASGDAMVEVFRKHITVSNPGGLVPWLKPEDFGKYSRTRNRLLASMLMRTPYIEKLGTGVMRVNQALSTAGLPDARFSFDEYNFSITLHSGVTDTESPLGGTTPQATPQVTPQATPQVAELVRQMTGDMSREDIMLVLNLKDREHFRKAYLKPALDVGVVEMTIPDKPKSGNQRYRLTKMGIELARNLQPKHE